MIIGLGVLIGWVAGFWAGSHTQYKLNKSINAEMMEKISKEFRRIK